MTREFIDDIKRNIKAFTSSSDFVMEPRLLITDDITRSTMTEQEWLTSEDPVAMLEFLTDEKIVSDRKLELFCVTGDCLQCQKIWRDSVWTTAAWKAYNCASANCETPQKKANLLREIVGNPHKLIVTENNGFCSSWAAGNRCQLSDGTLVHCPEWFSNYKIRDMAQHIYDTNEWDLMPQLGDLLEESGCDNEEILRHCQQEKRCVAKGPYHDGDYCNHGKVTAPNAQFTRQCEYCNGTGWIPKRTPCIRGCWVVDLFLGNN